VARDGYDAWNSLGKPYMGADLATETVTTLTLDSFVEQHRLSGKIRAIKIDVEGWEAHVLGGGRRTLAEVDAPVLIVEFTEEAAALAGSSCEECYAALRELGYRVIYLPNGSEESVEVPLLQRFPNMNVVATKNGPELL
jgi:hypothetical protein